MRQIKEPISIRDKSDLKQLCQAIASDSDFFITNDHEIRKIFSKTVKDNYGLIIVPPDELVLYFDELLNQSSYQESKLAGSSIKISKIIPSDVDYLINIFSHGFNQKSGVFRENLNRYISSPQTNQIFVVKTQDQTPLAIFVYTRTLADTVEIPLFRILTNDLTEILASQLSLWIIRKTITEKGKYVIISDGTITKDISIFLEKSGFLKIGITWIKVIFSELLTSNQLIAHLKTKEYITLLHEEFVEQTTQRIENAINNQDYQEIVNLEKLFWPVKIIDGNIPTFVIPIKPIWAIDLFDYELGNSTLFGSDSTLILKIENVYYRSSSTHLPTCPSRVLWYVSKGKFFQNVMSIRCCSYVDETEINTPKELFKQYKKIGVYQWRELYKASKYDINHNLLAFRFSFNELFPNPIELSKYKNITNRKSASFAPISISNKDFISLYKTGFGLKE